MARLLLILVVWFASSAYATDGVTGFLGYTYFDTNAKKLPFSNYEVGFAYTKKFSDNWTAHASVYGAEEVAELSSAYLSYSRQLSSSWLFTSEIGRIRQCYCLFNDKRFTPAARGSVVLPQAIYWAEMHDIAKFSDGIGIGVYHSSGLELTGTYSRPDIQDPRPLKDHMSFPEIEKARMGHKLGIAYSVQFFTIGAQTIKVNLDDKFLGHQEIYIRDAYIKVSVDGWTLAGEALEMETSLGRSMNAKPARGWSVLLDKALTDSLRVRIGQNKIDYRSDLIEAFYPAKNKTTDTNVGVSWQVDKNWTLRAEHHWVEGKSWLPVTDNLRTPDRWHFSAIQAVYAF